MKVRLLPKVPVVLCYVGVPFGRDGELGEDGGDGADRLTSAAVYALIWVYEIHIVIGACVDAVHGTGIHAAPILNPDARFSDNVGHLLLCPPGDAIEDSSILLGIYTSVNRYSSLRIINKFGLHNGFTFLSPVRKLSGLLLS